MNDGDGGGGCGGYLGNLTMDYCTTVTAIAASTSQTESKTEKKEKQKTHINPKKINIKQTE